jgi:hypothetical protein
VILGLSGAKRSGKGTAAAYLVERYGFHADSFAAPLRRFACDVFGLTPDELEATKETEVFWLGGRERPVTPRRFMQVCGTEFGRTLMHPEIWVESCMRRVARAGISGQSVVIHDCRFGNEASRIRQLGGKVVHLVGRGETGDKHVSEIPLHECMIDFSVRNDGSLEWLHEQIDRVVERASGMA